MTSAILIDDEPLLVAHLQRLLASLWPELDVVATGTNGQQALQLVERQDPDLLFLDIRMPVLDGLAVADSLSKRADTVERPLIIFTTAFDDHAVAAFESAAFDYLLKPIDQRRLAQTIARLQLRLQHAPSRSELREQQDALAVLLSNLQSDHRSSHLNWLRAGNGDTTELIPVDDVVYFKSEAKYTSAYTATSEHLLRLSLTELADKLDPDRFWRIHRGLIVNVGDIRSARRDLRGRYTLTLRRRAERIRSSQAYGSLFKQM